MTPDQIQSEIDTLTAESDRCLRDGERRAVSMLLAAIKRLQRYLPLEPPSGPVVVSRPVKAADAPELDPELVGVPKGVFDRFTSKSGR